MAKHPIPTPEILRQLLDYRPETGKLFWREREGNARWNTGYAGKEALTATNSHGYLHGQVMKNFAFAHRVAWAIIYGVYPSGCIDHIDGDPANNRIDNLRDVPSKINSRNGKKRSDNSSGVTGVRKRGAKWLAYIRIDYKRVDLGSFDSLEAAVSARKRAEEDGDFHRNHGR